jgi:transcriptional regulator with XRE-family HTH domain
VTEFTKTVKEAVGRNVRTYRQLRGLDQEALARRLNVGLAIPWRRVTVSEVERGERHVTVTELLWLALALETTIEQLLDTRGPERLQGPWLVPLQKVFTDSAGLTDAAEPVAEPGREAIHPEDLTALVCRHKARAVAEWDDETGTLKALRYEQVEQS